ncbi:hypothetical protein OAA91_01740 [Fibrobacterales bacterium]|nr:hypothetical protein [Fibrobacterales bacterium]
MKTITILKTTLLASAFLFLSACGGGPSAETDPMNDGTQAISEDDAQSQLLNAKDDAMGAATKNHELRKEIFTTKKTLGISTDAPETPEAKK